MQCEILIPWKAKKEYVRAKYQRADQTIYEPKWDFIVIFWILGLRTADKIFEIYLETLRQQFTMGVNNGLIWSFLLVVKAKIRFDKRRIH